MTNENGLEAIDEQHMQAVRQAVAAGISDALSDPDNIERFWTGAYAALQKKATEETGRVVLNGGWRLLTKGITYLALGFAIFKLGGWAMLGTFWQAITKP